MRLYVLIRLGDHETDLPQVLTLRSSEAEAVDAALRDLDAVGHEWDTIRTRAGDLLLVDDWRCARYLVAAVDK